MIEILIAVVVLLVVLYVVKIVIAELGLPANIQKVVYLIIGLIALAWLLQTLGVYNLNL